MKGWSALFPFFFVGGRRGGWGWSLFFIKTLEYIILGAIFHFGFVNRDDEFGRRGVPRSRHPQKDQEKNTQKGSPECCRVYMPPFLHISAFPPSSFSFSSIYSAYHIFGFGSMVGGQQ